MENETKLTGASFGILGDSYSTFEDHIPEGNRCYYPRPEAVDDVLAVEQTWWHLLMTRNHMQMIVNDSYSGATVCEDLRSGLPAISAYTQRAKRSFSGEIQPDFVFVFGGTNDNWLDKTIGQVQYGDWTEEDLKRTLPAFCYVLDYLREHNPQATIVVPINTGFKSELHTGMLTAAAHYGAVTICLENIDKKSGHPSALGMQQIADQIEAALA
jgi:hypothetical protein